ncbi:hypothetical protein TVAG_459340 [Trichomonas vaginalis G3]|uniref:Cilia- and flagella-associated protein 36 n=1 Tax=Trichomonas vaginalis (strain ATCC PRA-98 / G3) TaxID=412133 RepID=A2FTG0_TRIV3|nr:phosphodiesterase HL family [Trichomonas vaginalis G3]EAX91810.1 hypothetical protein TVAG_459340 [Trichomonas vaginalis G3]KAI5538261.1 phosphodiesterase HL family [Trichomonas vaginalis G3]|eukprot:XP_001304740.1 hypothetical protein [Trichomonas vaginalis G3]
MSRSDFILSSMLEFLASDSWWSNILDFMLSKCEPFQKHDTISIKEFIVYQEYLSFLERLLYNDFCNQFSLEPRELEETIANELLSSNKMALQIQEQLLRSTDFITFREDMIAHNERIEQEVNSIMNVPNLPIAEPESIPIHEPEVPNSKLPSLNLIPSPRGQRFVVNPNIMPKPSPRRKLMINPEMRNISQLPMLLSKNKEYTQVLKSPIPLIKLLKPLAVKLPPLSRSPRY